MVLVTPRGGQRPPIFDQPIAHGGPSLFGVGSRRPKTICGADSGYEHFKPKANGDRESNIANVNSLTPLIPSVRKFFAPFCFSSQETAEKPAGWTKQVWGRLVRRKSARRPSRRIDQRSVE
jgi:hypothetical protein